ncbi:MAG: hypothetical protein WCG86_06605 [Actinomycetota bacterium]
MINSHFVIVASVISLIGGGQYAYETLRGRTSPNRVTWTLWAVEPLLGFVIERQQGIGLASLMTLVLGVVPVFIVAASFASDTAVWKLGTFDIACGTISVLGLVAWPLLSGSFALLAFVLADTVAAFPTMRKAWLDPATETATPFYTGTLNGFITLLTLTEFTTAGALFPMAILVSDLIIGVMITSRLGPRLRGELPGARA